MVARATEGGLKLIPVADAARPRDACDQAKLLTAANPEDDGDGCCRRRAIVATFACPGSQAEGKRYHDWDGCIEQITQLDAWPDVRTG
jgi:hypothetical protein